MYYIYHIKGKKWGCTKNPKQRLKKQGYEYADEVILESDLDNAADLEKELNIKYGYPWRDDQDYRAILNAGKQSYKNKVRKGPKHTFTKKDCQLGGYITGKKKSEKQQKARRNNVSKLNIYQTCPYCGLTTRGAPYYRYHGDKCKSKN
jgi:excinuclease UvrABC ATPase subunit